MNAPLIVVHGDLLLPTIYPLAGTPLASYGEEWTLTLARPALNEFEIPFYAARFLTAYLSPHFRNDRFPYTPVSLWGKFKRNDELQQPVPPSPPVEEPPAIAPPPFAFEPFTAPDDMRVKMPPPSAHDGRKQLAGGAIALACAAFIAWALFGTKIGHPVAETSLASTALSTTPVAKPMPDEHAAVVASANVSPLPLPSSLPLPSPPSASAVVAPKPASAAIVVAGKQAPGSRLVASADQPKAIAPPARLKSPPMRIASDDSTTTRAVSQMLTHHASTARAKSRAELRAAREAHRHAGEARRYAQLHHHHREGYPGNPTYRVAGQGEPLTSGGQRAVTRQSGNSNGYLTPAEMYGMLAHSPVLDDNSGMGRASSRQVALAGRSAQRAESGESPGWNGRINQARVTDVPAQFSK
jgi:hypothetical protein